MEKQLSSVTQQIQDHCKENTEGFDELRKGQVEVRNEISGVKKELQDLKLNHVVFKTRSLIYIGIGAGILSAIAQILISYIIKHI